MDKLVAYVESSGRNHEAYEWMVRRGPKLQADMGQFGLMHHQPPFQQIVIRDWPIVVNSLEQMNRWSTYISVREQQAPQFYQYADCTRDAILRYLGYLEAEESTFAGPNNPLVWFRYGIRTLLLLPVDVLTSFGFNRFPQKSALLTSGAVRTATAAVSAVSFAANIVTIVAGKDAIAAIANFFNGLLTLAK
ncbi:hypothetical protein F183_A52200 [Bryobacterales bacterium F-183]|nr:hypothetical protein F183_A52200 [Bryobacterales bacterium F-183]